jgi:NAD(P)-dependent dehydrogenase (short-subunit alcohol dehydrogenase family)
MGKLEGQVAFITGAAHGQGRSHAKYLAREGAKIVAVDICEQIDDFYPLGTHEELQETVAEVEAAGSEAIAIKGDVRCSADMKAAVDEAVERFGTIDILCNNAGLIIIEAIDEMSDHTLDVVIDTCLKGVFNTTRFVAPIMKAKRSGKIINTSSAGGVRALPYVSPYAAAKGGVVTATKSWANELAEWDINVNAIAPGSIETHMCTGLAGQLGIDIEEAQERFTQRHLFKGERGHIAVDDISKMVVYLASDDARMITGQVFLVDAGFATS